MSDDVIVISGESENQVDIELVRIRILARISLSKIIGFLRFQVKVEVVEDDVTKKLNALESNVEFLLNLVRLTFAAIEKSYQKFLLFSRRANTMTNF